MSIFSKTKARAKKAAALKYDANKHSAPQVVGVGEGFVAEKMLETAKESQIPVVEDITLTNALLELNIGDEIPEELYFVIAQVLAFITKLDKGKKDIYSLNEIVKEKQA